MKITVDIASPPDREKLVAQINFDCEQWAEIHQEKNELTLEIYPRVDGQPWTVSYDDALSALQTAKVRLVGDSK